MTDQRRSAQFLDQMPGFQQALDAAASADEIAALTCRMVGRVVRVAEVRVCLAGRVLPPSAGDTCAGCHECALLREGVWTLTDHPQAAVAGCCAGVAVGRRSVPLRTHRHWYGFLLLTLSKAWTPGTEAATVAVIAQAAALALENRELRQRLDLASGFGRTRSLEPTRQGADQVADGSSPGLPGGRSAKSIGTLWPVADGARLLARALEQSPASIVITTPDGAIEYVNPGFVKATGYPVEEVLRQNPRLLKSGLTAPEDYRAIWQVIGSGGIWRGELLNRRRDGSLYWVAASISPVRDEAGATTHYFAVEEDITELKALQQRLARTEERYRGASEASRDGLFILDAIYGEAASVEDFRFVAANVTGCTMIGKSREQVVGGLLSEILPFARAKGFFDKYRRVFLHREVLDEQLEIADASVLPVWIHHTVVPLTEGIAITSRNISELKRYEAALMAARAGAEEANAAKSVFLATMSHELRTPLNAILGFSELIRDEVFGPVGTARYVEYASDIHASGRHLLDLITAILDLSKIEAGKLEIELNPIDLVSLLTQCVALVRTRAEKQGLRLVEDFSPNLPMLWADARAVRQIMLNLLSNAVKFTPVGGTITLHLTAAEPDSVDISVSDTGIGIPDDQVDRVMKPFEQLDNRYTRGGGGTGLGLALVKALAELHGGSVTLISKVKQGTTVIVRLPCYGSQNLAAASWSFNLSKSGL